MTAEIQIHELFKKYPGGTEALKGVSLEITKGQFFTLLGPNGAGKSTLVKIITTLILKDSGSFPIAGLNPEQNRAGIQKTIGVASQDDELDPGEKAGNMLVFQGRLFGLTKQEAIRRANEMALIVAGKIHYSGSIAGFKKMVGSNVDISLEDSYLQYIKTFTTTKISKN